MRFRLLVALSFFVVLACAVPAQAAGGGGGSCPAFASGASISILNFCFEGVAHFAEPGTTLRVTNDDDATHDFTAVDGSFASGIMDPGDAFELALDQPGVFRYYCTLHGRPDGTGMAGVLVVGRPGALETGQDASAALPVWVGALVIAIVALAAGAGMRAARLRANRG